MGREILKEQKLTIGVDLGDRWVVLLVLEEQARSFWTESADDTGSDESRHFRGSAKSHRAGDRNTFALRVKPAVND